MAGDGTFELKSGPGKMRINVFGTAGWTIRSVRLNGTDITDAGIEFKAGEDIAGLEVEMTNKVTAISGLVTNARGEPVKEYSAIAFAQDREKWKMSGRYQGMGRPDQDGRFKINALPPGDYYIVALDKIDPGQIERSGFSGDDQDQGHRVHHSRGRDADDGFEDQYSVLRLQISDSDFRLDFRLQIHQIVHDGEP